MAESSNTALEKLAKQDYKYGFVIHRETSFLRAAAGPDAGSIFFANVSAPSPTT